MTALKPFLMLACTAFAVGFLGYLGLVRLATSAEAPTMAEVEAQVENPRSSTTATPASTDDWNAGKLI